MNLYKVNDNLYLNTDNIVCLKRVNRDALGKYFQVQTTSEIDIEIEDLEGQKLVEFLTSKSNAN